MPALKMKYFMISVLAYVFISPDSILVRLSGFEGFSSVFWKSIGNFLGIFLITCFYLVYDKSYRTTFQFKTTHYLIAFFTGLSSTCFVIVIQKTTVANVLILFTSLPMIFSIFVSKLLLRENTHWQTIVAGLMCILGTLFLTNSNFQISEMDTVLIIILACFGISMCINLTKKSPAINTLPAYLIASFGVTLLCLIFVKQENLFATSEPQNYIFAIMNGFLFQTAFQICVNIGAKHIPSPVFSMLIVLELVIGIFLASIFLKEIPNFSSILGGLIIIFTLVFHSFWLLKKTSLIEKRIIQKSNY